MRPSALLFAAGSLPLCAAQFTGWPVDGGSLFRNNYVSLPSLNLNSPTPHVVFTHGEPPEDTVSMVEEYLLQSPLVTANSRVVLMLDSCTVALMPDVAALEPGDTWLPLYEWDPTTTPTWHRR